MNIVEGDLLNFSHGINRIAHSCNTLNVMGAGIAKAIKNFFPYAWQADCIAHKNKKNILGSYSFAWADIDSGDCQKGIYNLYTQSSIGIGREVNYEAFYLALSKVRDDMEANLMQSGEDMTLGLPYGISCGLAGGNWTIISAMINDIFQDSPVNVLIVELINQHHSHNDRSLATKTY